MSVNVLNTPPQAKTFNSKAKLLKISNEDKIELLNELYKGKLGFVNHKASLSDDSKIRIIILDDSINVLEIPDIDNLDFNWLFVNEPKKLVTLKLPVNMPKIAMEAFSIPFSVKRLFAWNDSITNISDLRKNCGLEMLIMQYSDGRKPVVYRF